MDKNTVKGLLLMGVVFLLFMIFTPKEENKQKSSEEVANPLASEQTDALNVTDSVTAQQIVWLKSNINDYGTDILLEGSKTAKELVGEDFRLVLAGDSVYGSINVEGQDVTWNQILKNDPVEIGFDLRTKAVAKLNEISEASGKYGKFAQFTSGEETILKLENDVLALELSSKSGTISRAELKKYNTEYHPDETEKVSNPVVLFENGSNELGFKLPYSANVNTKDLYFTPKQLNDSTVLMTLDFGQDAYWGLKYTLPKGESYVVNIAMVQKNISPVLQSKLREMSVEWSQLIRRQEKGKMFEERNSALYYKYSKEDVENLNEMADDAQSDKTTIKWVGFKNQFFSSVLVARSPFHKADFTSVQLKDDYYLKYLSTEATISGYDWTSENPVNFDLFLGPNLYPLLSNLDDQIATDEDLEMTRLIPLGWGIFRWINTGVIIPLFTLLSDFIGNYGVIILLLTIFIKLILLPLTFKSYKSQAKMKILAPDIKAINEKYPSKEEALIRQQKTMALYSKAGASPFSGCLPMLLQLPILFAIFSFFPSAIELRGQSFLWADDLSAPDAIISWSGNIPIITEYFGNHISLFCLLMTVTNILYTRISMQSQGGGMPGMKWMMYLMPVFFMVFFNNYASGLSYYYFLSLLLTILQTYAIRKFFIKEEDVRRAMAENAKKPKKKSGFMARLEEVQRQQQQMLKEQQKRNGKK